MTPEETGGCNRRAGMAGGFIRLGTVTLLLAGTAILPADAAAPEKKAAAIPQFGFADFGWSKIADDFQAPESGPGPVSFEKDHPYIPNNERGVQVTVRIADVTNPILKPWAAEQMKQANARAAAGKEAFEARASCRPGGVPGLWSWAASIRSISSRAQRTFC